MRFSLRWLFVLILLAALGIVSLMYAGPFWLPIAQGGVVLMLSSAVVCGIFSEGNVRAWPGRWPTRPRRAAWLNRHWARFQIGSVWYFAPLRHSRRLC
jgi:hypothetical protein